MKLYIKNMVCIRCKMVVQSELEHLGLHHVVVDLGEVEILDSISSKQREQLDLALRKFGLELMDNRKSILIEKIKRTVIEMVHYSDAEPQVKFSDYISTRLGYDYILGIKRFAKIRSALLLADR